MPSKVYTNEEIYHIATKIRKHVLGIALRLDGCYLSQACSSAELVATLYLRLLNLGKSLGNMDAIKFEGVPNKTNMNYQKGSLYNGFDPKNPDYTIDRFFVSCCHYASVIYSALVESKRLNESALNKFNIDGYNMEMIGAEHNPGFENTTGSLGQTISIAAGTAHAYKIKNLSGKIICMLSDGEIEEGQEWECFQSSAFYKLDNLIAYVDKNGQQVEGWTKDVMLTEPLIDRMKSFGWECIEINGHDVDAITNASKISHIGKPLMIICDTCAWQGIPLLKDMMPNHYLTIPENQKKELVKFYESI